jgi:N utilization substance protein B
MKRAVAREIAVRLCYELQIKGLGSKDIFEGFFEREYYEGLAQEDEAFSDYPDENSLEYIRAVLLGIEEKDAELEGHIEKYSIGWKNARISKTALAILKVAMFEVLFMPEIPPKVSLNEAVALAKNYEDEDIVRFINGVLGGFVRGENLE